MSENVSQLKDAVNKAFAAMQKDKNLFTQYKANPLQVLESHGVALNNLDASARSELSEQLSVAPSVSSSMFNFKCEACKVGVGTTLALVGGAAIIPILLASLQSSAAEHIIQIAASFAGLSFNAVVQVVQAVLQIGGAPAELYQTLIKELCEKMGAC